MGEGVRTLVTYYVACITLLLQKAVSAVSKELNAAQPLPNFLCCSLLSPNVLLEA